MSGLKVYDYVALAAARLPAAPKDSTVDIRKIDFTGIHAVTYNSAQLKDAILVPEIVNNIRDRDWTQYAKTPWIVIGRPGLLSPITITMRDAVTLTPLQFASIFAATNYHPVDCFRAMYAEARILAPDLRSTYHLNRSQVVEDFPLSPVTYGHAYSEPRSRTLLRTVLADPEVRKRFQICAENTATYLRECIFTTYRNPEYYDLPPEFLNTMVAMGDESSTNMFTHWDRLRKSSYVRTTLDLLEKYGVASQAALEEMAAKDEGLREEMRQMQANEFELLKDNFAKFFPGALKGSVIEQEHGAGIGYYKFMITHTHPVVDEAGGIQPSLQDLRNLLDLRFGHAVIGGEGYTRSEKIIHRPFFVILQPADWSGKSFFGLVLQENEKSPIGRSYPFDSEEALATHIASHRSVKEALASIGIESGTFKCINGRYSKVTF